MLDSGLSRLPSKVRAKTRQLLDLESAPVWFHAGQLATWQSRAKVVGVVAGWQSGKTVSGPHWLIREIGRTKATDYAAINATYPLLRKKQLPELLAHLKGLRVGTYKVADQVIVISQDEARALGRDCEIRIWLGSADRPDSLESATYGAIWFDEPGQAPEAAYRVCRSRLAIHRGRILLTSKPYTFNWYKRLIWDQRQDDPDIEVISYKSTDNPTFPPEEYEAARRTMPDWLHAMYYDGRFTRPAGAVYDCFDSGRHVKSVPQAFTQSGAQVKRNAWLGVDFGSANMAGVLLVEVEEDGQKRYYAESTYHQGGKTDEEHAQNLLGLSKGHSLKGVFGGTWSEDEWRARFAKHGLAINRPPWRDVSTGIACVYRLIREDRLFVDPSLSKLLREFEDYQFKVTEDGAPLDEIQDKSLFHRLDALRYVCMGIAASEGWGEEVFYGGRAA